LDSFFLGGDGAGVEVYLLLLGGHQGEANSWLWLGALENRVFGQYIVLKASPEPSDLNPWIQRLLGTSRTLMVTPTKVHKSSNRGLAELIPYGKSLSQSHHQFFEFRNCFCSLQRSGSIWRIWPPFWTNFISINIRRKFITTVMLRTFPFDVVFRSERVIFIIFTVETYFRKLRILPNWEDFPYFCKFLYNKV
jgi:hypothetical protein